MSGVNKTLLQFVIHAGGVLGFALLLDQVINLADEIPPIVASGVAAAPGPEQGPDRAGPERAGPDNPVVAAAVLPDPPVQADPSDVRPMLQMFRDRWLMVRPYEGLDYLYFSTVLPYRCGLTAIRYGLNGAKPVTIWPMEPCHTGALVPNALLDLVKFPVYATFPPGTVRQVSVELSFADGTIETMQYDRAQILQP